MNRPGWGIVTPAGMVSVKSEVSVSGVDVGLPRVMVSVAGAGAAETDGTMFLASVGPAPENTVNCALAAGALPPLVDSALVVLMTDPGVDDVRVVTMIVQPPTGIVDPLAMVIEVEATVTPVQDPTLLPGVLPGPVVTPAGMVSVSAVVSVNGAAVPLTRLMVSVVDAPATMVGGVMFLLTWIGPGAGETTVNGALAGRAVPPLVASALVVLTTAPGVDEMIGVTIVQPPGGIVDPLGMVIEVAVTVTPWQVP